MVDDAERPVPLTFSWALTPLDETLEELVDDRPGAGRTSCTSPRPPPSSTRRRCCRRRDLGEAPTRSAIERRRAFRFGAGLRQDAVEAAPQRDRRPPRRDAAALPAARRAARAGRAAHGHLRHRHPRRRHQRADPHRAVQRAWRSSTGTGSGCCARGSSCRSPAAPAGRASTRPGYVVVQAPEHVIENERAKAKSAAKNAAMAPTGEEEEQGAAQEAARGHGRVDRADLRQAGGRGPEPLVSRMKVDNAMLGQRPLPRGGRVPGAAAAAHRQPRGPARAAPAGPAGAAAGPVAGALRRS